MVTCRNGRNPEASMTLLGLLPGPPGKRTSFPVILYILQLPLLVAGRGFQAGVSA